MFENSLKDLESKRAILHCNEWEDGEKLRFRSSMNDREKKTEADMKNVRMVYESSIFSLQFDISSYSKRNFSFSWNTPFAIFFYSLPRKVGNHCLIYELNLLTIQ